MTEPPSMAVELQAAPPHHAPQGPGGPDVPLVVRAPSRALTVAALAPALCAVGVLVVLASSQSGAFPTTWYPSALLVLCLLGVAVVARTARVRDAPRIVLVALACFAAYTAWSYASIGWAVDKGDAWDGANRTLLYLLLLALLALPAQTPRRALAILAAWVLGLVGLALVEWVRLAHTDDLGGLLVGGRLVDPAGYVNAAAATWLAPFWPALLLAGRRELPPALRGALAAGAVVLADLALLSQSRGSLIAAPLVLVALLLFVPGRVRTLIALVPVGAGLALTVPGVLDAARAASLHGRLGGIAGAGRPVVLVALGVGAFVALVGLFERDRPPRPDLARRAHRTAGVLALGLAVGLVIAVVSLGHVGQRLDTAWTTFKGGYGQLRPGQSRLSGGLGSNRYDFYRVGLNSFRAHPWVGVGADNFASDYLKHGRSDETPHYPHSVQVRTLSETGVIGAVLLLAALGAALAGGALALRHSEPLGSAVAAGALLAFAYWLVHGTADWFWELAGLGAPAFAMLGLALSLAPRPASRDGATSLGRREVLWGARLCLGVGGLAAAATLTLPWLAERDVRRATVTWPRTPAVALAGLGRAARLNPLSERPLLVKAAIAQRLGRLDEARGAYATALRRNPEGAYQTLELGAIAAVQGRPALARTLLARAAALSPRDDLIRGVLADVRAGRRLDLGRIDRRLAGETVAGAR